MDSKLLDTKHIRRFLNSLVKLIKMKKLIDPIVKMGNKNLPGVSGIIMIETSHCSIHTFTRENRFNLDIYSCRNFSEIDVYKHISNYFHVAKLLNKNIIARNDGQQIEKEVVIEV
jgi:S-adenosylmethionine/arginine decarboxylase-like enzyme|tara:strand:- start:332 stop:676 length:345 start_codon:yes stop_codon:yes gene_type:complete